MSNRAALMHESAWQGALYLTGGGSGILSELLTMPGASATVLEAQIPYASNALNELLGTAPDQACSAVTARALAMAAFQRSQQLGNGSTLFGLGCTAALATNRPKRGQHRACIALQTEWQTLSRTLVFNGDRLEEEAQLVDQLWALLGHGLGIAGLATAGSNIEFHLTKAEPDWHAVLSGVKQTAVTAPHDGGLLLSGSFNPLHDGHLRMLAIAEKRTGRIGAFELSLFNADKPALDYTSLKERLAQFQAPVWLTRLPRFIDKASHFPGAIFALGIDTLIRLADPQYYGSRRERDRAIQQLRAQNNHFIVFDRQTVNGFLTFADAGLPESLRALCESVSEHEFRNDISSSAMRREIRKPPG